MNTNTSRRPRESTELTELHEIEFAAWAIQQTRDHGAFAPREAPSTGTDLSPSVLDQLVTKYLQRGLIESAGKGLYRWLNVPPQPQPRTKRTKRHYTPEERALTVRVMSEWALNATESYGKFSENQAVRESGLPSTAARRALALLVEASRVVRLPNGTGYRWADAKVPTDVRARRPRSRYTEDEWARLRKQVAEWSASLESFTTEDVRQQFGVSRLKADQLIREYVAEGKLVHISPRRGYAWYGRVRPAGTLADVLDAAKDLVRQGSAGRRGRLRKDQIHDVSSITTSQFTKLTTLANFIARRLGYRRPSEVSLSSEVFQWDTERSAWRLREAVERWTVESRPHARNALRASVSLLLAIAEAHGLLAREQPRRSLPQASLHAAEWQSHVKRFEQALTTANGGRCRDGLITGVRILAAFATRRGELDPASATWSAIQVEIDKAFECGALARHAWHYARRAYEGLRALGLCRGPQWVKRRERIAMLPTAACRAAAEHLDFRGWVDGRGTPLALIGGPFGLRDFCRWATLEKWELRGSDLPPREYIDPNEAQQSLSRSNQRRGRDNFRLGPHTLLVRLQHINYLLGWLNRFRPEVDVSTLSLLDLCDARFVNDLGRWLRDRDHRTEGVHPIVRAIAHELAIIASPFLEARARQLRPDDEQLARTAREKADTLREFAVAAKRRMIRHKDIKKIARAWRGRDLVPGWIKLARLRDLIIRDIERLGGGSLAEQRRLLERGELKLTEEWALKVRSAVLVNLVRLIPLRRRTVSELTLDMWENDPVLPGEHGRELQPWEGAIILNIPGRIMKSGRDFDPAYIAESKVGKKRWEEGAVRDLLFLWFARNGARDRILRLSDGTRVPSDRVFPALARSAACAEGVNLDKLLANRCRWDPRKLSEHFADLVRHYAKDLALDIDLLEKLGGLRLHVVRLLFGSYWAPRNLYEASRLLDHTDINFTARVYCGDGVRQATREAPENYGEDDAASDMPAVTPPWAQSLMAQLKQAELRAEIAERRLAELAAGQAMMSPP